MYRMFTRVPRDSGNSYFNFQNLDYYLYLEMLSLKLHERYEIFIVDFDTNLVTICRIRAEE